MEHPFFWLSVFFFFCFFFADSHFRTESENSAFLSVRLWDAHYTAALSRTLSEGMALWDRRFCGEFRVALKAWAAWAPRCFVFTRRSSLLYFYISQVTSFSPLWYDSNQIFSGLVSRCRLFSVRSHWTSRPICGALFEHSAIFVCMVGNKARNKHVKWFLILNASEMFPRT